MNTISGILLAVLTLITKAVEAFAERRLREQGRKEVLNELLERRLEQKQRAEAARQTSYHELSDRELLERLSINTHTNQRR